ncbi:MAG: hypothetical protein IPO48_09255 [Saprospiraceae bacterium]|nr:hypothetical protein [Saprospiraceae bacterium]
MDTIIKIDTLTKNTKVKKGLRFFSIDHQATLDSGREDTIIQVKDYVFAEENPKIGLLPM